MKIQYTQFEDRMELCLRFLNITLVWHRWESQWPSVSDTKLNLIKPSDLPYILYRFEFFVYSKLSNEYS